MLNGIPATSGPLTKVGFGKTRLLLGREHYAAGWRTGHRGRSISNSTVMRPLMVRKQHKAVASIRGSEIQDFAANNRPRLIAFSGLEFWQTLNRDNSDFFDKVDMPVDSLSFVHHVARKGTRRLVGVKR